jgi:hypothetical protein
MTQTVVVRRGPAPNQSQDVYTERATIWTGGRTVSDWYRAPVVAVKARPAQRHAPLALFLALLALVAGAVLTPGVALGDGDPASDVLLGQNVFFPYNQPSQKIEDELYSVTDAAQRAGFPLKIALIQSKVDLGAIPQYFHRPEIYARYLSYEIGTAVSGQVLVVMANGFGRALNYHALTLAPLAGIKIAGPSSNDLGLAVVQAAEKLAAAAGHPLGADAASQSVDIGV